MSNDITLSGGGFNGGPLTMSSREIADLCSARHNDVVDTIERLFAKGVLRESRKTTRTHTPPGGGRPTQVYDLTKRDSLVVVSGYDDAVRAKIIDKWIDLETAARSMVPVIPTNMVEALRLAADAMERAETAERTKAEIGSRREATAMATASRAVREARALQAKLDALEDMASVKRMESFYKGREFNWRLLKRVSAEIGCPIIDVSDANYGSVKAYHADAWMKAYGLPIPSMEKL